MKQRKRAEERMLKKAAKNEKAAKNKKAAKKKTEVAPRGTFVLITTCVGVRMYIV